jgi:hypothetical protein
VPSEKGTPLLGYWSAVDDLLSVVQMLLDEMIAKNSDEPYGLLGSARDHVIAARGDVDADMK